MKATLLLVDDEERLTDALSIAMEDLGYHVITAGNAQSALTLLTQERVDLVMTDLRLPDMDGRELLREIRVRRPELPVILITAFASVRDAVDLVKEGAFDYLAKPFAIEDVAATVGRALRLSDVVRDNERLRAELGSRYSFENVIGDSPAFRRVIAQVSAVCESRTSVLLTGESGTGKEVVARAIHFNSPRKDRHFVAVNCAAIPEGLLESELFGHVKGAFTGAVATRIGRFEAADGGTLLLDEVGDMPIAVQAKILRVLQERSLEPVGSTQNKTVDVRVIAATHKDLRQAVVEGRFREDLYYRLNVYPIELPPLRERKEDIPVLAAHFLVQLSENVSKKIGGFSPGALEAMTRYRWPGNIRELQNCIERAVIVARGNVIDVGDLPEYLFDQPSPATAGGSLPTRLDEELERCERAYILLALEQSGGVQVKAAELLGVSERSLWHRIKKLGIKIVKRTAA
jgi:DNA-binding NtrC family response regulator